MKKSAVTIQTRVLIVDENRQIGVNLTFMLAARKFEDVRSVRSAARAIAIAQQFRPQIVFLDIDLPDGGSAIVARRFLSDPRQQRPRLIALSRDAEHPFRKEFRASGYEKFLVKPVTQDDLDDVLRIAHAA